MSRYIGMTGRDAHRALEAQSENFWLTLWIRRRIAELERALEDAS